MRLVFIISCCMLILSCNQPSTNSSNSISNYFTYNDSVESAGVKMIPIKTPVGEFKVWTKRFGIREPVKHDDRFYHWALRVP